MAFAEDFLHYLWKFRLFSPHGLQAISGEPLEIINPGFHNKDSGPDFENAQVRIGDTLWAGNVEIHVRSSDWDKHRHSEDKAYNNVVLHVVHSYDKGVFRDDGSEIQTLELNRLIPLQIEIRYRELMENLNWIPCEKRIGGLDDLYIRNWLARVLIERLQEKSETVKDLLIKNRGSWDDAFYIMLARNFGFKTNALPFELLAASLPRQILARHKESSLQMEALIFGQAGFLSGKMGDEYSLILQREYFYLRKKYSLKPLDKFIWKFLRMRPQNFPTIRLAQFAAMLMKSTQLFSKIIEFRDVREIKDLFSNLPVNNYWKTHFRFDKDTHPTSGQAGDAAINNILVNTVCVFLYTYGKQMGKQSCINTALKLLESLPAEINQVMYRFTKIGISSDKADTSQALLQLKKYYCDQKKCLNCGIGIKLIKKS